MYTSTRSKKELTEFECIIKGLSDDGGLFICDNFSEFKMSDKFINFNYNELSFEILKFFFNNFNDNELKEIINNAYNENNFKEKIVNIKKINNELSFLELYYGPTMAFKDMALTILPYLMSYSKKKINKTKTTLILTATSGDTGGACLSGFSNVDKTKIIVLYPTKGVSKFQELQMHYYTSENAYAIAVEGNFDDCQNLVKKIFNTPNNLKNIELSSANSINIGRLVPQTIYYFYTYFELIRNNEIKYGDLVNFVVPTGNFGNILACYIAKEMGLFIDKIVCASNENNVLTDFFNTLIYNKKRLFIQTNSPSMDILISSNLERLLFLIANKDENIVKKLMSDLNEKGYYELPNQFKNKLNSFKAYSIDRNDTINYIKDCFEKYNYLIDPHTAVAYGSYCNFKDQLKGKTVVVSTASPYKFIETVNDVFKIDKKGLELVKKVANITKFSYPIELENIYNKSFNKTILSKDTMENDLWKLIGDMDENC